MIEEKEILERLQQGDETAFNQLVRMNQKNVHMLALRLVGDPEEALDISQKAFIRAYKGIGSFRGDSSLATWLYKITYNLALKHLNSARIKRVFSLEGGNFPEPSHWDAGDETIRRDFRVNLQRAVDNLPAKQRAVFTLLHLQGLKMKEAAEIMGLKVGTIKAMNYQAVRKLRETLKEWKNYQFAS